MDIKQLGVGSATFQNKSVGNVQFTPALKKTIPLHKELKTDETPNESYSPSASPTLEHSRAFEATIEAAPSLEAPTTSSAPAVISWSEGGIEFAATGNGPISSLLETPPMHSTAEVKAPTLAETLKSLSSDLGSQSTKVMNDREDVYLGRFPFKEGEKAIQARNDLQVRYDDSRNSAKSIADTMSTYAGERGVDLSAVPDGLTGDLSSGNLGDVKKAAQGVIDKFFLSQEASMNPDKHATVSKETSRFLDLAQEIAPDGFTAADAYKLAAENITLLSFQDHVASENMLGDHGVRHLVGHNIAACEQLADGLERQGTPVGAGDRLTLHQAMIVHDLGYAMSCVRDGINEEGIKGQEGGHNVLAAKYIRDRANNPDDPMTKLFGSEGLQNMHRCVLYHDKDVNGKPGVELEMTSNPTPEQRAKNMETITRVADNSHAFEDKLPELLYREPKSFKALRLMKTAGELGDKGLVEDIKADLSDEIASNPTYAKDDRKALLQAVSSVIPESYKFAVDRIAGSKPTFDITPEGKVKMDVQEVDTHQDAASLFGMANYHQIEKFMKDYVGDKVSLSGQAETVRGGDVEISFHGSLDRTKGTDAFNENLRKDLLGDKPFVKFALLDSQLSQQQGILEEKLKLGGDGASLTTQIDAVKVKRREMLDSYRAGS